MKVVVHGGEDRARPGIAPNWAERATAERRGEPSGALDGARQTCLVVVEGAPVVHVEEIEAKRLGCHPRERIPHEHHVAVRLRHLLPAEPHRGDVDPKPREGTLAGGRFALRDLILMVRIDEIAATAVHVDRFAGRLANVVDRLAQDR